MTTPSGTISLSDIQAEFTGANPISINEYYALAGYVPSGQGVPSSGQISFDDLRGKSNITILTAPASSILYNVNVRQALIDSGWDQNLPATYIIPATTYITSTTTATPALTVSGSFPNGITIVNNGYILGRGGNGGGSGGNGGAPGGHAIYLTTNCSIDNKNTIAGGGGGGGSGQTGDNYSSGGGGGGAPFGVNGGSAYYYGGSNATISTAGIADMLHNPPYGGYGADRWGVTGGNGGDWGQAGISGNSGGGRSGPGAGAKAGAFIDGYNYATLITRGTLLGEIRWSGPTSYQMTTRGVNAIVASATNYISYYVVADGSNPGSTDTSVVDDNYWGRLNIRKNGGANFNWYLYGTNLMDNFYLGSNGFIATTGYMYSPSLNSPEAPKLLFNARDLQMYRTWLSMTASTNDCFRLYYGSELYGNADAGAYDTKELVFYNPANTGGMMVVLIKYGGNGQFGGYRDGGTNLVANSNGSQFYNFSSYVGAGKNVLLVGDSTGTNWQAFNGYIVNSSGTIVNN